ncbi:hypothetical protein GCM10017567_50260 [Amycolatopsis bullii]|uniref:Uncharacterized protein n=1 Tax=Amycolatopsis bullii TaxID=941987 RepID=A0ABQ3KHA8_9PSEU|nr:hypothetical protein GCM10017567_50260 [Amycolatopsis bullii]
MRDRLAEARSLATDVAHGSHVELLWIWVIEMSPDALGNSTIVTTAIEGPGTGSIRCPGTG